METIAETMKISAAEVTWKLYNLRCQMNSEVRKLENKISGAGADEIMKTS